MLWLCLDLPALPLEVFARAHRTGAVSVHEQGVIVACNAAAARAGIAPGLTLSAALALADGVQVCARAPAHETAALARLADCATRFSSSVSLEPPRAVLLEIGASLRLFGEPERLRARLKRLAQGLGYSARAAAAPTPTGALWLARAGAEAVFADGDSLRARLANVPVSNLPLPKAAAQAAADLGLRLLGECLRLPRAGLLRRFGAEFVAALDRALGRAHDARVSYQPPVRLECGVPLPAPVSEAEALLFPARRLFAELALALRARDGAAAEVEVRLIHSGLPATVLRIGLLTPRREAGLLAGLLRERLHGTALPAPVEELRVATTPVPWRPATGALLRDATVEAEDLTALIERLRARLGSENVSGIAAVPEHRPERGWRRGEPGAAAATTPGKPARPVWLLPGPLAQTQVGAPGQAPLRLVTGPERIESGWWDGGDMARDYFVAEDAGGARYWVFRERRPPRRWFVQGLFG